MAFTVKTPAIEKGPLWLLPCGALHSLALKAIGEVHTTDTDSPEVPLSGPSGCS